MLVRRALDRENVTEALSVASELDFVSLAEALELTLILAAGELEKYNRHTLTERRSDAAGLRRVSRAGGACGRAAAG